MWTIFKVCFESVAILLPFYVLLFDHEARGMEPAAPARECVNHWTASEGPPYLSSLKLSNAPIITPLYKLLLRCSAHLPFLGNTEAQLLFPSLFVFLSKPVFPPTALLQVPP